MLEVGISYVLYTHFTCCRIPQLHYYFTGRRVVYSSGLSCLLPANTILQNQCESGIRHLDSRAQSFASILIERSYGSEISLSSFIYTAPDATQRAVVSLIFDSQP